jgi:epoxyqueuosine reductase
VPFEFTNGEQHALIPIRFLERIRDELRSFQRSEPLNDFQRWIVNDLYAYRPPEMDFRAESILLVAVPHPFYSEVTLTRNGRRVSCRSLVRSDFERAEAAVDAAAEREGFHTAKAGSLPLKRLAVHSGLAVYGRNNITYIRGLGSNFSYTARYTDRVCGETRWAGAERPRVCETCTRCLEACPTGAIRRERFLIDNQRCLSYWNESGEPFPDWLPVSAHHTLYDCLRCQMACPMNAAQIRKIGRPVVFDEEETEVLMSGTAFESYPPSMRRKAAYLGLDQWPDGIAKNVRTLIDRDAERA